MFTKVKFIHSMRVFSEDPGSKKIITRIDFEKALEEFVDNDSIREQKYIKDYLKLLYI